MPKREAVYLLVIGHRTGGNDACYTAGVYSTREKAEEQQDRALAECNRLADTVNDLRRWVDIQRMELDVFEIESR